MRHRYGAMLSNIIHPTDFSHGSEVAFAHALKLTLGTLGQLEILHVDREGVRADWQKYPSVRETLSRWGILPDNAGRGDVAGLGVRISKSVCHGDAATEVLEHIDRRGADLVVMATHRREGLDRWLHSGLAEHVANRTDAATLFIPYGVNGFVEHETGQVSLKTILVPIDSDPHPTPAVQAVGEMVNAIAGQQAEVRLLHVGDPSGMPSPSLPASPNCVWNWEHCTGSVVDRICEDAATNKADLIVMTTAGHDGFLDAIRGSTTERVLQHCACPVLSVPRVED